MEVVHERCCGLDVHKRTVVACLLTLGERGQPVREVRTFGTTIRLTNRWNTIPGTLISRPHWRAPVSATLT
jgi:hypothetical protein